MSRKRAKAAGESCEGDGGMGDSGMPGLGSVPAKPLLSYASMLRNASERPMEEDEMEFSDADCCFVQGESGLAVKFSDKVHAAMESSWRFSVVVNLMGKPSSVSSFDFILRGLRRKWRSSGNWKLIDLPNDYFVVKFELESDMNEALCGGPWILAGQTLVVRRWSAAFNPMNDKIASMAVWARVVGLPIMYFTEYAMSKVGKLLGEVIKVDQVTLNHERGRFGRVCVEIELNTPLKPAVEVDGVKYRVQYEGLSLICFNCGVYGHLKDKCPSVCAEKGELSDANNVGLGPFENTPPVVKQFLVDELVGDKDDGRKKEEAEGFGPWMLINYRGKKKLGKNGESAAGQGSRFSVLQGLGEEVVSEDPVQIDSAKRPAGQLAPAKSSHGPIYKTKSVKDGVIKVGIGETVGEVAQLWSCLQDKIKEKSVLGEPWSIGNDNGALVQANDKVTGVVSSDQASASLRMPLVDLSNAAAAKYKASAKMPRKAATSGKSVLSDKSRMPFPKNSNLSNINFSGFFGRCPPEEVINKEVISSLVLSKESDRFISDEAPDSAMDDDSVMPSSIGEEVQSVH